VIPMNVACPQGCIRPQGHGLRLGTGHDAWFEPYFILLEVIGP
jgi:hypothetical protein